MKQQWIVKIKYLFYETFFFSRRVWIQKLLPSVCMLLGISTPSCWWTTFRTTRRTRTHVITISYCFPLGKIRKFSGTFYPPLPSRFIPTHFVAAGTRIRVSDFLTGLTVPVWRYFQWFEYCEQYNRSTIEVYHSKFVYLDNNNNCYNNNNYETD